MGTDPNSPDNRWLLDAMQRQIPVIYFLGKTAENDISVLNAPSSEEEIALYASIKAKRPARGSAVRPSKSAHTDCSHWIDQGARNERWAKIRSRTPSTTELDALSMQSSTPSKSA